MSNPLGFMPSLTAGLLKPAAVLDTVSAVCLGALVGGIAMVALLKRRRRAALLAASGLTAVLLSYGAGQASLRLLKGLRAPAAVEDESFYQPEPRVAFAIADPGTVPAAGETSAFPAAAGAGCRILMLWVPRTGRAL
ncbi:MAG TPA: hypothetical protein VMS93_09355 [Candidatus Saccharimonadales bacterium]|nr:hypothetical protein [Candidatus Saccharimonadales bacterium]